MTPFTHDIKPRSAASVLGSAVGLLFLVAAPPAYAQTTYEWDGGGFTTDWHTAANWDPNGVPGADDIATIPNAANPYVVQITSSGAECASLNLGATNLLYVIGQNLALGAGSGSTTTSSIAGTLILQEGGLKGASILSGRHALALPCGVTSLGRHGLSVPPARQPTVPPWAVRRSRPRRFAFRRNLC